jgi:hypothetical protein
LLSEYGMNGKGIDVERAVQEARQQIDAARSHPGPVRLNMDGLLYTLEYRGLCTDEVLDQVKSMVGVIREYAGSRNLGFEIAETRTMRKDWNPIALEFYGK